MAGIDVLATAFNGANAAFIADMYARWVADPNAVDPSFAELFAALNDESRAVLEDASGASWAPRHASYGDAPEPAPAAAAPRASAKMLGATAEQVRAAVIDSIRALMIIRIYRVRGHLEAKLDPLGLQKPKPHPELDPMNHGFTEADMDRPIFIDNVLGRESASMREIIAILRAT